MQIFLSFLLSNLSLFLHFPKIFAFLIFFSYLRHALISTSWRRSPLPLPFEATNQLASPPTAATVRKCRAARAARRSQRMPRGGIKATPAWHPTAQACGDPATFASPHQNIACASFVGDPIPQKNYSSRYYFLVP